MNTGMFGLIVVASLCWGALSAGVQAETITYTFDDGTLEWWTDIGGGANQRATSVRIRRNSRRQHAPQ